MRNERIYIILLFLLINSFCIAQQPVDYSKKSPEYKNVIRYNLSGALLFGFDSYIVFGYEHVISPRQSFSVNIGRASLPRLISINTDSFNIQKDKERNGLNVSVDYRFYLAKENKYKAPHGFYIGPYYSFNRFNRENQWTYKNRIANNNVTTQTNLYINTMGVEGGYQLILWNRLALDFVMVGPGFGFYKYRAIIDGDVEPNNKKQLVEGLKRLLVQRFPGMDVVFQDKEINAEGIMRANGIGYRYIIHIGFIF